MGQLFDVESNTITYHLIEIFNSGELEREATTRKFRVVQKEGSRSVNREIEHFNLDVIISVGYRVNSIRATYGEQEKRDYNIHLTAEYLTYVVSTGSNSDSFEMRYEDTEFEKYRIAGRTNQPGRGLRILISTGKNRAKNSRFFPDFWLFHRCETDKKRIWGIFYGFARHFQMV